MRRNLAPVLSGAILYLALFAVFFPPAFATPDENEYLTTADAIRTGAILDRDSDQVYYTGRTVGDVHPFKGRSLLFSSLLAPLLAWHWKLAFVLGALLHLLTFGAFAWVLVRCGRSAWWAWLVLFHPTLSLLSRMVMADVPSATASALILLLLVADRRRPLAIGVVAGVSLFLRSTNLWFAVAAGIQLLVDDLRGAAPTAWISRILGGSALRFGLCYGAFCLLLLGLNAVLYGGPFETRYAGTETAEFAFSYLVEFLPIRLLSLSVFWPAMMLGVFFLPRRVRWFGIALVVLQLVFFSSSITFEFGSSFVASLVRSMRYLVGSVITLCVGYVGFVEWVLRGRSVPSFLAAGALLGALAATALLFDRHYDFLQVQAQVTEEVYAKTPEGSTVFVGPNARELFSPVLGARVTRSADRAFLDERYQRVRPGDIFVFYYQPPPRTVGQEAKARAADRMIEDLGVVAEVRELETRSPGILRIVEVLERRPKAELQQLSEAERSRLFPSASDLALRSDRVLEPGSQRPGIETWER